MVAVHGGSEGVGGSVLGTVEWEAWKRWERGGGKKRKTSEKSRARL